MSNERITRATFTKGMTTLKQGNKVIAKVIDHPTRYPGKSYDPEFPYTVIILETDESYQCNTIVAVNQVIQDYLHPKQQVIDLMRSSNTREAWSANIKQVKKACNGFPDYWFKEIVLSGLINEVSRKWGRPNDWSKTHIAMGGNANKLYSTKNEKPQI